MSSINNNLEISWFEPNIVEDLWHIDIKKYFFYKHGLRHPSAMYAKKINIMWESFLLLLKEINKDVIDEWNPNNENKTTELFIDLIHKFNSFIDVLSEITLGFYDIKRSKGFIYKDLQKNNIQTYDIFYWLIKNDIDRYKSLNNHFKHTSNYIEFIQFYSKNEKSMWYFISTSNETWKILPDEKFHKKWNKKDTWTSFNKELRELFYLTYKVSDLFNYHVINKFKSEKSHLKKSKHNILFKNIYEELSKLDESFFPNEENDFVYIAWLKSNKLKISEKIAKKTKTERKFTLTYSWDWVANEFWLLY
jgi:hypothetical protein